MTAELLHAEYLHLYGIYEGYNAQVLELKGWSVTIGLAALIGVYTTGASASGRIGVVLAALASIPFWLIETFWKVFQTAGLSRINELELCAANKFQGCQPMQAAASWRGAFEAGRYDLWMGTAFDWHVLLPHLVLLVGGLLLEWKCPPSK